MKYFANIKTLDELKAAYRRLSMQRHPDCGGDTATMQEINAEHDELFELLKKQHNATADEYHQTTETPEEFRAIIELLLRLDGLTVEPVRLVAVDRRQYPRAQGRFESCRLPVEQ